MSDILRASGVTKRFGGLVAVNDIDFSIPEKAIVSLIGPNGAGKTTFFNIIAGIYDPTAGEIEFHERKVIARSRRAWLEPVLWVLPATVIAIVTLVLGSETRSEASIIVGLLLTIIALMVAMLIGVARPPIYQRFLTRLGIFKSARPNDMVVEGLGRTFQNIRLFQNMSAMENVLVGMHTKLSTTWIDALLSTPRDRREEAVRSRPGARAPRAGRPQGPRRAARQEPAVRRPAPARDRPGAGLQPEAAAARRADRRDEPARDAPADRPHQPAPLATSG